MFVSRARGRARHEVQTLDAFMTESCADDYLVRADPIDLSWSSSAKRRRAAVSPSRGFGRRSAAVAQRPALRIHPQLALGCLSELFLPCARSVIVACRLARRRTAPLRYAAPTSEHSRIDPSLRRTARSASVTAFAPLRTRSSGSVA